jgi:putative redox protein
MHTTVTFKGTLPLVGVNEQGHKTRFDATMDFSGPAKHATPMETILESLGACSMIDIIAILKKMRKEVTKLDVDLEAERADEHPKVFTSIHVKYRIKSPDCTLADLQKATALSMDKYCSVAAMIRGSGCKITWSSELA